MKIIATTERDGFIVEMSGQEVARAAGFYSTYDDAWERANGGKRAPQIGTEFKVDAAYDFHSRVESHQKQAKDAAGMLRALAEMLEHGLPDVVIPPHTSAAEGDA